MSDFSLQFLPGSGAHARAVAQRLRVAAEEIAVHTFPDAELRVTVRPPTRRVAVYAPLDRPNGKIIALLFAAEALRRNGAERLILVSPYLCYMRQDAALLPGEAISQKTIGEVLSRAFDRVITVDAHLHRVTRLSDAFPGIEADNLSAMQTIADGLRAAGVDPATVIVGPDAESEQWAGALARATGLSHTVAAKRRTSDISVDVALPDPSAVRGRPVILLDDLVSSGGTLKRCAQAVRDAGATAVDAVVTHALFDPALLADFRHAGIRTIWSTTSVPHPTNRFDLDAIQAEALRRELSD